MSAAERMLEPSMDEILNSIRRAISEDHSRANSSGVAKTDPFGSESAAVAAFSSRPDGKPFDTSSHTKQDPFSELNAKLDERRQSELGGELKSERESSPDPRQAARPKTSAPELHVRHPATMPAEPPVIPAAQPVRVAEPQRQTSTASREQVRLPQSGDAPAKPSARVDEFRPISEAFSNARKQSAASPPPSDVRSFQSTPTPRAAAYERPSHTKSMAAEGRENSLLSASTDAVTAAAFGRLTQTLDTKTACSKTVEDLVVDILTPILKQWLDQYLPELVEELVRAEIERVARQRS
jgi:cell pole-organizing protein PopZ